MIAEILTTAVDPELFRKSLIKLEGNFDFSVESMIKLGEVYCRLYPDSVTHADSAQVQIGYRIVRIAITENILNGMEKDLKKRYREMFTDISSINSNMHEIISSLGLETTQKIHKGLDTKIKKLKSDIDSMENSVIKERYIGGITLFYNVLYLMKRSFDM